MDGKIAVIGLDDQNSMTTYHYVEQYNQVDYRYYKSCTGDYIKEDGIQIKKIILCMLEILKGL